MYWCMGLFLSLCRTCVPLLNVLELKRGIRVCNVFSDQSESFRGRIAWGHCFQPLLLYSPKPSLREGEREFNSAETIVAFWPHQNLTAFEASSFHHSERQGWPERCPDKRQLRWPQNCKEQFSWLSGNFREFIVIFKQEGELCSPRRLLYTVKMYSQLRTVMW